jgi:hypothetical protein
MFTLRCYIKNSTFINWYARINSFAAFSLLSSSKQKYSTTRRICCECIPHLNFWTIWQIFSKCDLPRPRIWQLPTVAGDARNFEVGATVTPLNLMSWIWVWYSGPLRLVRIIEEPLEWKSSGSGQENRINDGGYPLRWPRDTLYPQRLSLISPTNGGRSVGVVRLRTKGHGL